MTSNNESPFVRKATNPKPVFAPIPDVGQFIDSEVERLASEVSAPLAKRPKLKNWPPAQDQCVVRERGILKELVDTCLIEDLTVSEDECSVKVSQPIGETIQETNEPSEKSTENIVVKTVVKDGTENQVTGKTTEEACVPTLVEKTSKSCDPESKRQVIVIDPLPAKGNYNRCEYVYVKKPRKGTRCDAPAKHGVLCSQHIEKTKKQTDKSNSSPGKYTTLHEEVKSLREQHILLAKQVSILKNMIKKMKEEELPTKIPQQKTKIIRTKISKLNKSGKFKIMSISDSKIAIFKTEDKKYLQVKVPALLKKAYDEDTSKKLLIYDETQKKFKLV